jgi:hypothetical protein
MADGGESGDVQICMRSPIVMAQENFRSNQDCSERVSSERQDEKPDDDETEQDDEQHRLHPRPKYHRLAGLVFVLQVGR